MSGEERCAAAPAPSSMTPAALSEAERRFLADRVLGGAQPSSLMVRAVERILNDRMILATKRVSEPDGLAERLERLLDWGVGRTTNGVDRMIPASDLRALLAAEVSS